MKTKKFNFSDYDEVSRDEMRDMVSTSSGPLPPIDSGSGSGSGSDASPEVIACNGKTVGDECHWTSNEVGLSYHGACNFGPLHEKLYCDSYYGGSGSGSSSGSGTPASSHFEAQKNACRSGQSLGAACYWSWAGTSYSGICYADLVIGNICGDPEAVKSGTANGALYAREMACLGKPLGAYCKFTGDDNQQYEGKCRIDNMQTTSRPLFCSQSIGVGRTDDSSKG